MSDQTRHRERRLITRSRAALLALLLVIAVCLAGPLAVTASLIDPVGATFNLQASETVASLQLVAGYNFISLPLENQSFTASTLIGSIGSAAESITKFDSASQSYVTYDRKLAGFGVPQDDFAIQPNVGYIVYASRASSLTIQGHIPTTRVIPLRAGYNLVGWTSTTSAKVTTALINPSNGVIQSVSAFDESSQQYTTYDVALAGFGVAQPDFQVLQGRAYFCFAHKDTTITYAEDTTMRSPTQSTEIRTHIVAYGNEWAQNEDTITFIATNFDVVILDLVAIYARPAVLNKLKSLNTDLMILFYRDIMAMHPEYEDWSEVNLHEDWFVHDIDGNRLQTRQWGWYCMDVGNAGWRSHYANFVKTKLQQFPQLDGVFADDTWNSFQTSTNKWTVSPSKIPGDVLSRWHNDQVGMLEFVKKVIGSRLIIPNASGDNGDYVDASDGKMEEAFIHPGWRTASEWRTGTGDEWTRRVEALGTTSKNGKYYLAHSGTAEADLSTSHRIMLFCFASYLLGVHGNTASFGWENIYSPPNGYWTEYDKARQLGAPVGDYYSLGSVVARDFENGKVLANPSTSTYTVPLGRNYKTLDGQIVSRVTLDSHTGVILLST